MAEPLVPQRELLPGGQRLWFWLTAQRAGLRRYHWLFIAFSALTALAVAVPRLLAQPVVYYANATVVYDTVRYAGLAQLVDGRSTGIESAFNAATESVRWNEAADGNPAFGTPQQRVDLFGQESGRLLVRGVALTPGEAQRLADAAALQLVRQIRAAGGREILRNLLGHQLWQSLSSTPGDAADGFAPFLRTILRLDAFPLAQPIEPFAAVHRLSDLSDAEVQDLTRALEARSDLWRAAANRLDSDLDRLCGSAGAETTAAREQLLAACSTTNADAARLLDERNRIIDRFRAVDAATNYLIRNAAARFVPDQVGAAYRIGAALPATAEPRYIAELTALALLVGTAFGAVAVAIDRSAGVLAKLLELWQYRELIQNLILRELRARYKGSALGYLWTQIAPLGMMMVYVVVFGVLLPGSLALFPLFVIAGLLPWTYTAESVVTATRSILDNAALVKRTYFPREVLPLVAVGASLVNFVLSLPMMLVVLVIVQMTDLGRLNLSWAILYLPVILLMHTLLLSGVALLLSAAAVFLRDIVHLVGIAVNVWFFLSPVIYPLSIVEDQSIARLIRWLNPLASIIEFYREVIYGNPVAIGLIPTTGVPALSSMLRVTLTALIVLGLGYWFFQRVSQHFGEEL